MNFISDSRFFYQILWVASVHQAFLKFKLFSSKVVSKEFFLRLYCKLQFGGLS